MKLREFIQYRELCPICNNSLKTSFQSLKKQSIKYEEHDRIVALFRFDPLKKNTVRYKVGYSFGLDDNSWCLELYNHNDERCDSHPLDILNKMKDFHRNMKFFNIYRHCNHCEKYNYVSNDLLLNLTDVIPNDIFIATEFMGMLQSDGQPLKHKFFKLLNDYSGNQSFLSVGYSEVKAAAKFNYGIDSNHMQHITLPLIKIMEKEELLNRLSKLLIFT